MNGLIADIGRDLKDAHAKLDAVTKQRDQLAKALADLLDCVLPTKTKSLLNQTMARAEKILASVQREGGK